MEKTLARAFLARRTASFVIGGLAVATMSSAHATCFTMVDAGNHVVYQSTTTPVSLVGSVGNEMARRFPGRHLIISSIGPCAAFEAASNRSANPAALLDARADGVVNGSFAGTSPAPVSNARPSSYPDGTIDDGGSYSTRSGYGTVPSTYPGAGAAPAGGATNANNAPAAARVR